MLRRIVKFRPKKRNVLILGLCLLLICMPVIALISFVQAEMQHGEIIDIGMGTAMGRQQVSGSGLDLSDLGAKNLLLNGGFEPLVYRKELIASGGDQSSIIISNTDQSSHLNYDLPLDNFFEGANVEIYTTRGSELSLKKTTRIKEVLPETLLDFHIFNLQLDPEEEIHWTKLGDVFEGEASRNIVLGSKGNLLYNLKGNVQLLKFPTDEDLVQFAQWQDQVLVLSEGGQVFSLNQDLAVNIFTDQASEEAILGLASIRPEQGEEILLLLNPKNVAYVKSGESWRRVKLKHRAEITKIFSFNDSFFLLAEDSSVFVSEDGRAWTKLYEGQVAESQIKSLALWNDLLVLAGDQGQVILITPQSGQVEKIDKRAFAVAKQKFKESRAGLGLDLATNPNFIDIALQSDHHYYLLDDRGYIYETLDAGKTWEVFWQEGSSFKTSLLALDQDGSLFVAADNGEIAMASLAVSLVLEKALDEGSYLPGDLVRLEKQSALPWRVLRQKDLSSSVRLDQEQGLAGDWYVDHKTKADIVEDDLGPEAGQSALRLSLKENVDSSTTDRGDFFEGIYGRALIAGTESDENISLRLSQQIRPTSLKEMLDSTAFEIEFWAKADSNEAYADIALTGPNLPKDPVRRYLTEEWQRHQVILIVPWLLTEEMDLRLEFDFGASTEVLIDKVALCKADQKSSFQKDLDLLKELSPDILRLSYLKIGNPNLPASFYFHDDSQYLIKDVGSLEANFAGNLKEAAQLVELARSIPWLCIESSVTSLELRQLMQYLFGSRQSEFGHKRMQDGSIARWNELFDSIYIEFVESEESKFQTDNERKAFVEWAMDVIESCSEYGQVRSQIYFIDGMKYEGGVILSEADAHASDFAIKDLAYDKSSLEANLTGIYESFPRDPMWVLSQRPEIIRSLSSSNQALRLADYMAANLDGLGEDTSLVLANKQVGKNKIPDAILETIVKSNSQLAGFTHRSVMLSTSSEQGGEDLVCYGFSKRDQEILLVLNLSSHVRLVNPLDAKPDLSWIREFDAEGRLLTEQAYRRRDRFFTLLPGGMLVVENNFLN